MEERHATDNGVRVERKLLNRHTETSGLFSRTRNVRYDVLIVAENLKTTAQTLSIQDNVPVSQDQRTKVVIGTPKLEDRVPAGNGVITWQLNLAPGERREIKSQYSI